MILVGFLIASQYLGGTTWLCTYRTPPIPAAPSGLTQQVTEGGPCQPSVSIRL